MKRALHIGVIAALRREARLLIGTRVELDRSIRMDARVSVYVCGMGQKRANRAARALLETGCEALVSFGTAGGLQRDLRAGALVIPERVLDEDGQAYAIDSRWRLALLQTAAPELESQPQALISVSRPVISREDKSRLADTRGACAVDMESAAIARVAGSNGLPLLVVRAVSDDSRQSLPAELMSAVDVYGELRTATLLTALCRHPGLLGRLPGLARSLGAAQKSLARVVSRAGLRFSA